MSVEVVKLIILIFEVNDEATVAASPTQQTNLDS